MKTGLLLALFVLLSPPALAGMRESDASYYARQMKSCIHPAPRENIWDFFAAFRERVTDECCADSVQDMAGDNARRLAPGDACPQGSRERSLPCPTSKHWCVPAADS